MGRYILQKSIFFAMSIGLATGSMGQTKNNDASPEPSTFRYQNNPYLARNHNELITDKGKIYLLTTNRLDKTRQKTRLSTPSATQWRQFKKALTASGACHWLNEYENVDVLDGGWIQIDIEYPDCKVHTRLRNTTPPNFKQFEKALNVFLLGGKTFYEIERR